MERAKIAVAVAIIRMKPQGVTGEEYARQLSEKVKNEQLHWKEQYEKAEGEILHLKQKLFMQNTNETVNQEQLENHEFSVESSQKLFPTPPHSGRMVPSFGTRHFEDVQSSLLQNTQFLHHVINIQTGSKHLSDERGLKEITQGSVLHSLQALRNHIGKNTVSWTIQKQCLQCIVELMNKSEANLQNSLLASISDLCYSIIETMMTSSDSRYENQEYCVQLLSMFGTCKPTKEILVDMLCEAIKRYSEDLKQYVQKKKTLDTVMFCNSYYLFEACKFCLISNKDDVELQESVKQLAKEKLEDSLLCISDAFPLYAHTIWRVCANL